MDSDSAQDLGDPTLDELASSGDRRARAELLERSRRRLIRFCLRYLGRLDDAEDAVQDVLATVVLNSEWPRGSLQAWLFRACRNRCLDGLKRRTDGREGAGSAFGGSAIRSPYTGASTACARQEEREQLRSQLDSLPPEQAEVLVLHYFEGLARKEVAAVLDLPESVVKSRLFEARERLRQRMQGDAP